MPQRRLAIICYFTNTSRPPDTAEISRQKGALQPGILNIASRMESSNLVSAIISISILSPVKAVKFSNFFLTELTLIYETIVFWGYLFPSRFNDETQSFSSKFL